MREFYAGGQQHHHHHHYPFQNQRQSPVITTNSAQHESSGLMLTAGHSASYNEINNRYLTVSIPESL
jgi:hypothetical protein